MTPSSTAAFPTLYQPPVRRTDPACPRRQQPLILRLVARFPFLFWLMTAVALAAGKRIPPASPPAVAESRYANLMAWGRERGLVPSPSRRNGDVQLTNQSLQISFKADSRTVSFDDVEHRLTLPVRRTPEGLQVAVRDIQTTLDPLLRPSQRPASRPIKRIAINAGHGGKDPGNIEGRRQEKHYTLMVAGELRRNLERAGLDVVVVRPSDVFISLEDRPAMAAKAMADLYVSLHFNAFDGPGSGDVAGIETYCLTPAGASSTNDSGNHGGAWHPGNRFDRDNILLGHLIQRSVVGGTDLNDRGVRRARFKELTLLQMPGVLVEGGYMTHPQDAASIYSPKGRASLARAIADGILDYKRLVERRR